MASDWFLQQALAGNAFVGSTAITGVTLPAPTATAQVFGLWNPAGSNVNVVLNELDFGASTGTMSATVVGQIALCYLANTGSGLGTPISAFTDTAFANCLVTKGASSRVRFTGSAATTTATTLLRTLGLSYETATLGNGLVMGRYCFSGDVIVPPGTYVGVTATAIQTNHVAALSLSWAEIPA